MVNLSQPTQPATTYDNPADLRRLALPIYGPSLLFGLGEGAILPVVALSARSFGASVAVAALMVMLINAGSLVFNVPASIICDRYGERLAIVGASALGVLATVLCLVAGNLAVFSVGVFLIGIASSVFLLARQTYLTEAVPAQYRARALSTLGGVMRVGVFIGPFLGAAAMAVWHLQGAYVVCVVALLLAGILGATLKDLPGHGRAARTAPDAAPAPTVRAILREKWPVFITVGVGILLVSAVRQSRQAVIPLWAEHLGLSPQVSSVIYGVSSAIDMLVFYPAGKVMDVRGRRWVTVPSMLVMGLSMLAMPLTHGVATLTLVSCILGFGNGIGAGMVMTLGADFAPELGRAQFLGIWREMSDIGGTAGPLLLAAFTALLGLGPAIAISGVIGLVAALQMWRAVPRRSG
nr:MFS transporter [Branchiibius hedensis]